MLEKSSRHLLSWGNLDMKSTTSYRFQWLSISNFITTGRSKYYIRHNKHVMIYSELWAIFMSSDFVCILNKRDKSMGENYILTRTGPTCQFSLRCWRLSACEGQRSVKYPQEKLLPKSCASVPGLSCLSPYPTAAPCLVEGFDRSPIIKCCMIILYTLLL